MTVWTYAIIERPDGKFCLRRKGAIDRYDSDHGIYDSYEKAMEARNRLMHPRIWYYDKSGNEIK